MQNNSEIIGMNILNDIQKVLAKTKDGVVLTPADFNVPIEQQPSLIVALNRLVASKELKRLSKGKYYKPKNSVFGMLPPETTEVVKDLLVKDNKVIGYITGTNAFSQLGLTTQISSTILIGTNKYRRPIKRGTNRVAFLLQPNEIVKRDINLLVLLDAIRLIQSIPAATPSECIEVLIANIKDLCEPEQKRLQKLAMAYAPYVRALLGAIYEHLSLPYQQLKQSLNGTTNYRIPISSNVLPTKSNWRII